MVNDTPIEEVVALMNSGMGDADIIRRLTDKDILLLRFQTL